VRAIQKESFDFLVHTGDFVQLGGQGPLWQDFFDVEGTLLRDHCVFACVGNHELFEDNEAARFERYFGPSATEESPKLYGSFRWADARFFLLNAFQDWSGGEERAWLERALQAADAESGLAWRIAVIHHSPWSAGPHGDNATLLAAGIVDLLLAHHVDIVLAGHDHIYERGESRGLKYIISGGGGAPLYREISPKPSTQKVESTYNFVLFHVSRERIAVDAKRPDGTYIEQCAFGHGKPWACGGDGPVANVPASVSVPPAPEPPPRGEPGASSASRSRCGCDLPGAAGADTAWLVGVAGVGVVAVGRTKWGRRNGGSLESRKNH
jgi:acid phosphatase type 7